ncbi:MAG: NAD-dependent succinate-semialdehyde dehydrogenase [Bauldia sp.]|nr:NAD-dependent succinate-semialdehyde dehydrogenase [Bauldia sp.]
MQNQDYPRPAQYVDGKWIADGEASGLLVVDPATGEPLADLPLVSDNELAAAIAAADRAADVWASVSAWERGEIIRRAGDLLRQRVDTIARWLVLEEGKPLGEAVAEVHAAADVFTWASEEGKRTYGRTIPSRVAGLTQTTYREPVGPSALFSPWNFPIVLPARKVATALAAGCTCVLKPAEQTPASAMALAQACEDAGVPPGVVNLVFGEPVAIADALIRSPAIRKISLTGSVPVGKAIARLAGDHLKKCTFELGGHAPVIVMADADLDHAVETLVRTKYRNAGQVCVSPSRFFVQRPVYKEFVERFAAAAGDIVVGPGLAEGTGMGPVATERRWDAVSELVQDAERKGARCVAGGRRTNGPGFFFPPTVLTEVPMDTRLMNDEPFGPVASIVPFGEPDEAIAAANSLSFGLAAYLFTRDLGHARKLTGQLSAGLVGINHVAFGLPETPMCGVKESGYGHEGGTEGIQDYLTTKFVNEFVH